MNARFARHPASGVPGAAWLLFGVFGAPAGWIVQLVVDYALAAFPCFAGGAAQTALLAGWEDERAWLVAVTLICLAIVLASLAASYLARQRAAALAPRDDVPARLVERTRVLAQCGLVSGAIFLMATLFSLALLLRIPQCSG